jgi:hypothetical protein
MGALHDLSDTRICSRPATPTEGNWKRKEVIQMRGYEKPELTVSANAVEAIQNLAKTSMADDAQPPHEPPATTSAYEADE